MEYSPFAFCLIHMKWSPSSTMKCWIYTWSTYRIWYRARKCATLNSKIILTVGQQHRVLPANAWQTETEKEQHIENIGIESRMCAWRVLEVEWHWVTDRGSSRHASTAFSLFTYYIHACIWNFLGEFPLDFVGFKMYTRYWSHATVKWNRFIICPCFLKQLNEL